MTRIRPAVSRATRAAIPASGRSNVFAVHGRSEAILRKVDRGFRMDDQGAYGFNEVTGDYSFRAQGFWIENGASPTLLIIVIGRRRSARRL